VYIQVVQCKYHTMFVYIQVVQCKYHTVFVYIQVVQCKYHTMFVYIQVVQCKYHTMFVYIQVVQCKYHTVFVTEAGSVFTCGHGLGGRLGHHTEETCLVCSVVFTLSYVDFVPSCKDCFNFLQISRNAQALFLKS